MDLQKELKDAENEINSGNLTPDEGLSLLFNIFTIKILELEEEINILKNGNRKT